MESVYVWIMGFSDCKMSGKSVAIQSNVEGMLEKIESSLFVVQDNLEPLELKSRNFSLNSSKSLKSLSVGQLLNNL